MRTILTALIALAAAVALPGCASTGAPAARTEVMEASQRTAAAYAAAWTANDMYRFGSLFAEDARYVNLNGDFIRGRGPIVSTHAANRLREGEGARMSARLEGARAVSSDAIIAVMRVNYANAQAPSARLTLTLVRQRQQWLIAQAQASAAN